MNKQEILQQTFGYTSFRDDQEDIIDAILMGQDTMTIMPTGGGKSICYQLPALMLPGTSIVVSPLISLMKDQVNALVESGVDAAYINSSLTASERREVYDNAQKGLYKLLYVAPEQLLVDRFLDLAQTIEISLMSVDEAHCVSQWGQDFRPHYLDINTFLQKLSKRPPVAAFTATATKTVKDDIITRLELVNPRETISGFDRTNLFYKVLNIGNDDKFSFIASYLKENPDETGIVYCQTRSEVEKVSDKLNEKGYRSAMYHAGLTAPIRNKNQDLFLKDDIQVMVATNAFGMGIDKSNVSFVIHHNMPKNIENYYQEAGRAGRDGSNANCILLYSGSDVRTNNYFIDNAMRNQNQSEEEFTQFQEYERKRLAAMVQYAKKNACLRHTILSYFGESSSHNCGNCHNCLTEFTETDITIEAQKILSCVHRMGGRFGQAMVIAVLRGSKNEKVISQGLDSLSTYGLLKSLSNDRVRTLMDVLIEMQYLDKTTDQYPVVKLGINAKHVLIDKESLVVKLAKEKQEQPKRRQKISSGVDDVTLFDILRALRKTIADEKNVPAFIIFSDLTLKDMTNKKPLTLDEFLDVDGIGTVKCKDYGPAFTNAIKNYLAQ